MNKDEENRIREAIAKDIGVEPARLDTIARGMRALVGYLIAIHHYDLPRKDRLEHCLLIMAGATLGDMVEHGDKALTPIGKEAFAEALKAAKVLQQVEAEEAAEAKAAEKAHREGKVVQFPQKFTI